jgi:hypothetical protein
MSELEIDDLLSRHFDGRLSPEEARDLEQRMADDPALAEVLGAFGTNRDLLRTHQEAALDALDLDAFALRVMAALPEEAPVVAPSAAAALAAAAVPAPARLGPAARPTATGGFAERFRRLFAPVLLGAAVAAVATWFVLRQPPVELDDVPGGEVFVDSVSNEGPQTVLISQPVEEGGSTVIWLLEDEIDAADGADPQGDGGASPRSDSKTDGEANALPLTEDPI